MFTLQMGLDSSPTPSFIGGDGRADRPCTGCEACGAQQWTTMTHLPLLSGDRIHALLCQPEDAHLPLLAHADTPCCCCLPMLGCMQPRPCPTASFGMCVHMHAGAGLCPGTHGTPSGRDCKWRLLRNIYKNNFCFNIRQIPAMLRISTPGERCWCGYVLGYAAHGDGLALHLVCRAACVHADVWRAHQATALVFGCSPMGAHAEAEPQAWLQHFRCDASLQLVQQAARLHDTDTDHHCPDDRDDSQLATLRVWVVKYCITRTRGVAIWHSLSSPGKWCSSLSMSCFRRSCMYYCRGCRLA